MTIVRNATFKMVWASILVGLMIGHTGDAQAQNCDTTVGLPPINDLGMGSWHGSQGGLYLQGSNTRPASHTANGLTLTDGIVPLNTNGSPDYVGGKIIFLSVGMSNTEQEFDTLMPIVDALEMRNPYLELFNGAQGGQYIDKIISDTTDYWERLTDRLEQGGLSASQVQAIWFKEADFHPTDTTFPNYFKDLRDKFIVAMDSIHNRFPNAKLCYVASRTYGGYSNTLGDLGNPEPFAYYTGWAVKALIKEQLAGDLPFLGDSAVSPWLSWGVYLWADGKTPRSDSLQWFCEDFDSLDGRHPSEIGEAKVANILLDSLIADETARPWFLRTRLINSGGGLYVALNRDRFGADNGFVGGSAVSTTTAISGTEDDSLYQNFRRGSTDPVDSFYYKLPLPDGDYRVVCYFADVQSTSNGQRVFEIVAEDSVVVDTLDIYSKVGQSVAYIDTFFTTVTDDTLSLDFNPESGSGRPPLVSAIAIDYLPMGALNKLADIKVQKDLFPIRSGLSQNYPNPFNPTTTIRFSLQSPSYVTLKVFTLLGEEIATLVSGNQDTGPHAIQWDATGQPSGVYFYRLQVTPLNASSPGGYTQTKKLILLR